MLAQIDVSGHTTPGPRGQSADKIKDDISFHGRGDGETTEQIGARPSTESQTDHRGPHPQGAGLNYGLTGMLGTKQQVENSPPSSASQAVGPGGHALPTVKCTDAPGVWSQ